LKFSNQKGGIDTPEIRGKCEKEKYDAKQITLRNMERGKYFRIAADVIIDGESLGDMLVEAGMAVRYDGGKKKDWCQ
jgi:micrococcal nuclease